MLLSPLLPSDTLLQPSSAAVGPAHLDLVFAEISCSQLRLWAVYLYVGSVSWQDTDLSQKEGGKEPAVHAEFDPAEPYSTPPLKDFWSCGEREAACCTETIGT